MRNYAISTLFLVLALITGACAGRQVRSSRPIQALPAANAAEPTVVETVPAVEPDARPAPLAEQAEPIDGDKPASPIAQELASTDFDVQGRLQRDIDRGQADINAEVNRMVARMPRDKDDARPAGPVIAMRPIARSRHADAFPAFRDDAPKVRKAAPAAVDGREAAVGSLAAAAPAPVVELPAVPAAPSILPAPAKARDPAARAAEESPAFFVPDESSARVSDEVGNAYIYGSLIAAGIGLLFALVATWIQERRRKALAATPYDMYADGTVLVQKIVNGQPYTILVRQPDPSRSEPETDAQLAAEMEKFEQAWHAQGDAKDEEDDENGRLQPGTPRNRRFDLTDTPDESVAPPPTPSQTTTLPIPQPDADDAPRLASGSDRIVSTADGNLALGETPIPPLAHRSEPEAPAEKVIVYEDKSSTEQTVTPAAAATPN